MRAKVHVKKDDLVQIVTGAATDKGKRGKVIEVDTERGRIMIEKVNMVKRHQRPTQQNRQGGIIEKEAPIFASRAMIVCSKCDRPVRIAHRFLTDGKKVRVCRKCGEQLDLA